jgi:hypothetical protein
MRDRLPAHLVTDHIWPRIASARTAAVDAVRNAAAARFWHLLQDFALTNPYYPWDLPAAHPFLRTQDGRLTVHLPPAAPNLPAELRAALGAVDAEPPQPQPL